MDLQNPTTSCAFWPIFLHVVLLFPMSLFTQPTDSIVANNALGNETDRYALLKCKESIVDDPQGALRSWNDSIHFCNWRGVTCSRRHQRVTALNFSEYNLRGTISPYIGNLSFLRRIVLVHNSFYGEIPQEVGRLFRLQLLDLNENMLEGKIPVNLSYCSRLELLNLRKNRLTGTIPSELGSMGKLECITLGKNNLTGRIPASLGNLSSLSVISLVFNNLVGTIPNEFGRLKSLTIFTVAASNLSGTIPLSLYNISSMSVFSITKNKFHGILPTNIGHLFPNLRTLYIGENKFSGIIPESFSNASQLRTLDLASNNFVGQVPASLGNLPNLRRLVVSGNSLGSYTANSLHFVASLTNCSQMIILDLSYNKFGGVIPNSVANLSTKLTHLYLTSNQLSGNIPTRLENLVNLIILSVADNLFTGVIPTSLGKLQKLQLLVLSMNMFSGKIPDSIGNLTQLFSLNLSFNKLKGSIPSNFAHCKNLQSLDISNNRLSGAIPKEFFNVPSTIFLNLSRNSLSGNFPAEVGKLKNINALDLSENNVSSEIPENIGDCETLEFLYLQGNFFRGGLPATLASLRGLQYLDISRNNLTGKIPRDYEKLRFMVYLNISFNNLEGEVPKEGVFQNASAISLIGNIKLCGGVPKLKLQRCPNRESEQGKTSGFKVWMIIIVCVAGVFLSFSGVIILYRTRKSQGKSTTALSTIRFLSKVSYKRLHQVTNGFSPSMLIGTGSFSSVYKGILEQEENLLAIKVFNLQQKKASKSFVIECNALRNIRHRNIVKILTCCSSMDYNGNEFKALVLEYMSNGSLEKWLHLMTYGENRSRSFNFIQRLNIAVDVAAALSYLHNHCEQPIIHCDLKPSNILLNNEMIARVSDFGLASLVSDTNVNFENKTSTIGIKGTIGYAAPEYAMGCEPTRQGDVYSYGILVLEMFTGRRPTDEMFKDDFNLHNFVKMALPERLVQIIDSSLLLKETDENIVRTEDGRNYVNDRGIETEAAEEGNTNFQNSNDISPHLLQCLILVLEIGLACSEESPNERMSMEDVLSRLQRIKNAYMGNGQSRRTS